MQCLLAPSCERPRLRRGRFCRFHSRRLSRYGSVTGRALRKTELAAHAATAERVLAANAEHAGLKWACRELQNLLNDSQAGVRSGQRNDPVSLHWARLASHGVTPLRVLSIMAAVLIYSRADPRPFGGDNSYRYAIARGVVGLAPRRDMALGARTLDAIGSYMLERYAGLAISVVKAVADTEDEQRRRDEAMTLPLQAAPPTTNPI